MLPITNHKVVHVPHAIAVVAALIGMVTALSWDHQTASQDAHQTAQSELVIDSNPSEQQQEHAAKASDSDTGSANPVKADNHWSSSPTLPLFIPSSQGRQ